MDISRRKAILAGTSVGIAGLSGCMRPLKNIVNQAHSLSGEYEITEFVERDGSSFTLNGNEYKYNGMMALLTHSSEQAQKAWVNQAMEVATQYDIDAYRCWGFPAPWDDVPAPHTAPGEFDDTWLELFDYTIAKAKEQGVRLIVPLLQGVHYDADNDRTNYAPSPAAYGIWSETADYQGKSKDEFIDDEEANNYFKEWIEHILTRENQYTGMQYKDDPTILMWECANELERERDTKQRSLSEWYEDIASYVKSIDSTHLVSTGMHGSMGEIYEPWSDRCAYVEDHKVDAIDVCSFHDYPIYREGPDTLSIKSPELVKRYATHKIRLAHDEINKPVYAGEFGCAFNPNATIGEVLKLETEEESNDITSREELPMKFPRQHDDAVLTLRETSIDGRGIEDRNEYFEHLTDVAEEHEMNGVNFWRLAGITKSSSDKDRSESDTLIVYPSDDSTMQTIQKYSDRVVQN